MRTGDLPKQQHKVLYEGLVAHDNGGCLSRGDPYLLVLSQLDNGSVSWQQIISRRNVAPVSSEIPPCSSSVAVVAPYKRRWKKASARTIPTEDTSSGLGTRACPCLTPTETRCLHIPSLFRVSPCRRHAIARPACLPSPILLMSLLRMLRHNCGSPCVRPFPVVDDSQSTHWLKSLSLLSASFLVIADALRPTLKERM